MPGSGTEKNRGQKISYLLSILLYKREHKSRKYSKLFWIYGTSIEIKAKSNPTRNDGRGIGAFRECFPREKIGPGLIICAVKKPIKLAEQLVAAPWWVL
jgi:hypothetical protein